MVTFYKQLIENIKTVLLSIAQNPRRSYSINTGQTTESVTKEDIPRLNDMMRGATLDLQYWCQMCDELNGVCTATYARPGF